MVQDHLGSYEWEIISNKADYTLICICLFFYLLYISLWGFP